MLLGNWQARRAEEKRALGEAFDEALRSPPIALTPGADVARLIHKHVSARGRFVVERTVLLDNKLRHGRPGYEVVTPLRLGDDSKSRIRQNLEIAGFARETGLALHTFVVEQHSDSGDGLLREWPRPDLGVDMHRSYALQWYSLAALALVILMVLSFKKNEK